MKKIFFLFIISILLSNCCNFNAKLYNNRGVFTLPDYDKIKVTYDNSINFLGKISQNIFLILIQVIVIYF